jgi:hypothetical protein
MTLLAAKEILLSLEYYHFDIGMVVSSTYSLLLPECAPERPSAAQPTKREIGSTDSIDRLTRIVLFDRRRQE